MTRQWQSYIKFIIIWQNILSGKSRIRIGTKCTRCNAYNYLHNNIIPCYYLLTKYNLLHFICARKRLDSANPIFGRTAVGAVVFLFSAPRTYKCNTVQCSSCSCARYRVVYAFSSSRITRWFGLPVGVRCTHTTAVGDDGWTCLLRERTPSSYVVIKRGGTGSSRRYPPPVMISWCRILYIIRVERVRGSLRLEKKKKKKAEKNSNENENHVERIIVVMLL